MQLREVIQLVSCDLITGEEHLDREFQHAFGSDLMSDVLAYVENDALLLTGLINHQVIRTAEMLDLKAILFIRGKRPSEDVIALAKEQGLALLSTKHTMYTASGILYKNGLEGIPV